MTEKRCEWCVNYRTGYVWGIPGSKGRVETHSCTMNRPLKPCEDYEREPGADDDLWGGPAHMRQVEGDDD